MSAARTSKPFPKSTPATQGGSAVVSSKMPHQERLLTVGILPEVRLQAGFDLDRRPPKPWVRLHGLWLREAGFMPQSRVRVRVMPGCLVITAEQGRLQTPC
jgi:toxic protein SymE